MTDFAAKEFFVDVPGGRISVAEAGDGAPVLLLHAGVTDRRVWDASAAKLAAHGYRTLRPDVRGVGRSDPATSAFSLVADAAAVLDAAGVTDAHLVGLSQGAATAVDLALATPERVRTLTLVAPGLSGYEWPRLPGWQRRVAAAEADDAHALALEIARLWAPVSFDGHTPTEPLDYPARIVLEQAARFMEDEYEIEEPDARPRLGEIAVPTLVVLGDRDVDAIADIGRLLADGIPGARSVTLAGADHLLPLRVPEQLHDLLVAHLT